MARKKKSNSELEKKKADLLRYNNLNRHKPEAAELANGPVGPLKFTEGPLQPYPDNNPKTGAGLRKPQFGLIPSPALVHMAVVMQLGAAKYGPYNWREKKVSSTVYIDAAERHLRSYLDGEDVDPESGALHLAHVMACCAILIDALAVGNLNDNRPAKAPTAELIRRFAETGKLLP